LYLKFESTWGGRIFWDLITKNRNLSCIRKWRRKQLREYYEIIRRFRKANSRNKKINWDAGKEIKFKIRRAFKSIKF